MKQQLLPLLPRPYIAVIETDESGIPSEWANQHHRGIYINLALWVSLHLLFIDHMIYLFSFFDRLRPRLTKRFILLFTTTIKTTSMPRNDVADTSDEENEPEGPPRNAQKDISNNFQLPNRTHSVSEHTVSAKQQGISKFFVHLICISLMFTSR